MRVGIVGTGVMGSALARRLSYLGFDVYVWNRTLSKAKMLEKYGVSVASNIKELVERVEIIHIFVSDDEAVKSVFFSKDAIYDNINGKIKLVLNHSTVTPQVNIELFEALREKNVDFLEAPVMGSWPEAEKGRLHIFIGGDKELFERYRDYLSKIGEVLFYTGKVGTASIMKLASNMMLFNIALSLSESIKLVEEYGVEPENLLEYFKKTWLKTVSERYGRRILDENYPTRFKLSLAAKDLTYAVQSAIAKRKALPLTTASMNTYLLASEQGLGERDYAKVYLLL